MYVTAQHSTIQYTKVSLELICPVPDRRLLWHPTSDPDKPVAAILLDWSCFAHDAHQSNDTDLRSTIISSLSHVARSHQGHRSTSPSLDGSTNAVSEQKVHQ